MFKKMFALASVTALTGLVASVAASGCSSTTTVAGDGDSSTVTEAGGDAKKPPVEAGPEEEAGPTTCPTTTPITTAEIETNFKWMPPLQQNVCNQTNIDDLRALFAKGNGSAKYSEIKTAIGPTCAACAFTKSTAANWGLFLEDASGKFQFDNSNAACLALVDTAACGKADAEFGACVDQACADCADQAAFDACSPKAACKAPAAAAQAACTADATACDSVLSVFAVVCGGGTDGGLDASK